MWGLSVSFFLALAASGAAVPSRPLRIWRNSEKAPARLEPSEPQGRPEPIVGRAKSLLQLPDEEPELESVHAITQLPPENSSDFVNETEAAVNYTMKHPASFWNESIVWVPVKWMHPAGVISNVHEKMVVWADVNYLNVNVIYVETLVLYPAFIIIFSLFFAVVVSLCTREQPDEDADDEHSPPAASVSRLFPGSKYIYRCWSVYCRAAPSLMLFGMPVLVAICSYWYPQEVFQLLLTFTSLVVFTNGIYMIFFAPLFIHKMSHAMTTKPSRNREAFTSLQLREEAEVVHWLVLPNYKEDMPILCGAIDSVAQSEVAKRQVCVLLAMEAREEAARDKAAQLQERYQGQFLDMAACYHPPNLPNDPPGKASNVCYAFKFLIERLAASKQDTSKVVLTVADADSDFHEYYFDLLTQAFVKSEKPYYTLWQAPIFHIKNYHRQPMVLSVGTMFTALTEVSVLSDPNAVRFPYSTYSLSMDLATSVGGWDAEWIAEDWHMGIKCFLLTLGKTSVEPIPVPTVNYVPEDDTWVGTLYARWSQAKRHALGLSDLAYYFMMLPLIFARLTQQNGQASTGILLFCKLYFNGLAYVVRLVNTHVLIGNLTIYMAFVFLLKKIFAYTINDLRHVGFLMSRECPVSSMLMFASILFGIVVTFCFVILYDMLKQRIDKLKGDHVSTWEDLYSHKFLHWLYTVASFFVFGTVYVVAIAFCVWIAAIKLLFDNSFDYEVAAKPKQDFDSDLKASSLESNRNHAIANKAKM
mmetsp:Transcript_71547/g.152911  ORF Transcript_71547/g.152911 Transcript_71547/m.152911 type:complete len:756 (+) Transcript_71547:87-2354(+)